MRRPPTPTLPNTNLYQNYLEKDQEIIENRSNVKEIGAPDIRYAELLEDSILRANTKENNKKLILSNNTCLLPRLSLTKEEFVKKESSLDILKQNLDKAVYYEKQ